jgi:hypothetical protein
MSMVSKCANPKCSAPFQYFREGKIFQVEVDGSGGIRPTGPQLVSSSRKTPRLEHFWLCGKCSTTMTLMLERGKGVSAVPRVNARSAVAS